MKRSRGLRWLAVAVGWVPLAAATACTHRAGGADPGRPVHFDGKVAFDGFTLTLHVSRPHVADAGRPLILYATGDGGWRGKDEDTFEQLSSWDYPVAGFSAPSYLRIITRHTHQTMPADVARDYERMIAGAKQQLDLADATPTILVGVSRGSGLAVAAAGEPDLQPLLAGVVAIALTREEEYVQRLKRRRAAPGGADELTMLDNYEYLPRLRTLPLSIIQSTRDEYLPAEEARRLLGPDTALRQLHPIVSRNHSFSDARTPLYAQLRASLMWVCSFLPGYQTP